jgi:UDP-GlcNAc:undecaprenyl-phosphate/decaprenyl-phosphate GlcNAc-1-phosphate transferase
LAIQFGQLLGSLVAVLIISLFLTRFVRDHARRAGLLDPCDDRKIHTEPIPRLGGVAIFSAVVAGFGLLSAGVGGVPIDFDPQLVALLAGGAAMFCLGAFDDLHPIRARYKLIGQIAIAIAVQISGLGVTAISLPFVDSFTLAPALNMLFTVVWIVGITNAFNLIDGMDGLAAGVALFALGPMFLVGMLMGHPNTAVIAALVAAGTAGFLRYNFFPATIFLGDSGSLFLGYMLAGLGLAVAKDVDTGSLHLAIPVILLALPIADTALTIFRRFLRRQPIFSPDMGHIHHRLLNKGYSPRRVALILYVASAALATVGCLMAYRNNLFMLQLVLALFAGVFLTLTFLIKRLGFYEFEELWKLCRRAVRHRDIIGRNVRFREASVELAELNDMDDVLTALERVFREDQLIRAEVRLRRSFLDRRPAAVTTRGRADDELSVWRWSRDVVLPRSSWEIAIPLLNPDDNRIGSLVIWETNEGDLGSISHLQMISGPIRAELQRKLHALGWTALVLDENASDEAAAAVLERALILTPPEARTQIISANAG